jgi:hypothetical protein
MISKAFSGFSRRAVRIFSRSVMRVPYVRSFRHSAKIGPNSKGHASQDDYRKTTKTSVHEFMDFSILNCVSPSWVDFITTIVGFRVFGTHRTTSSSQDHPARLAPASGCSARSRVRSRIPVARWQFRRGQSAEGSRRGVVHACLVCGSSRCSVKIMSRCCRKSESNT